jgi:hypothetical protein
MRLRSSQTVLSRSGTMVRIKLSPAALTMLETEGLEKGR